MNRPIDTINGMPEDNTGLPWWQIGVGGAGAYYGGKWWLARPAEMTTQELAYLSRIFEPLYGTKWPEVLGYTRTGVDRYRFTNKERLLNSLKGFEESLGGLPRTLGLYATGVSHAYSGVVNQSILPLTIEGKDLRAFKKYYEALIGREFTEEEMGKGLALGSYFEGETQRAGLFFRPESEAQLNLLRSGYHSQSPLVRDASLELRYWEMGGVTHTPSGAKIAQQMQGLNPVGKEASQFPFLITGNKGYVEVAGKQIPIPSYVESAARSTHSGAVRLTQNYGTILDNPAGVLQDALGATKIPQLEYIAEHPIYKKFFKNKLGMGGNYKGTLGELWARHAKTALPVVAGLYLGYKVLESGTRTLTGYSPAQGAGAVVGGAQLAYSGLGEATGLNSLARYQERKAPGSTSPMALVGMGLAGGITAMGVDYLRDVAKFKGTEFFARRNATVALPEALSFLQKAPAIGRMFSGDITRAGMMFKLGALAGTALMLPFIPGMIGSTKSPEKLKREFSGEELVPIRRNRWWEFGRQSYEGTDIESMQLGWFADLMKEPRAKELEGPYYGKPLTQLMKSITDPYWQEKGNYYKYPAPESGSYTSIMGPLGPLYDLTIGSVIKPPVWMHTDVWGGPGNEQVFRSYNESSGLEQTPPTSAVSNYSLRYKAGEVINTFLQAGGLPGFAVRAAHQKFSGNQNFFVDKPVFENASFQFSAARAYYEQELGGAGTLSEPWRRFMPNKPWEVEQRNEIPNNLPDWMPGYLRWGNPLDFGGGMEQRLPGRGYAALHPEMQGVAPEDYSSLDKTAILGDLARKSGEYQTSLTETWKGVNEGDIDPEEYNRMMYQLNYKESGRRFAPQENLGLLGGYYRGLVDTARMNPFEYALPISPVHKFMGPTTVQQSYYESQMLGPEQASWYTPYESFIAPTFRAGMHDIGMSYVPDSVQEKRDIQGDMDALQYLKAQHLSDQYGSEGKYFLSQMWRNRAGRTFAGSQAQNPSDIANLFPRAEASYYKGFLNAPADAQQEMLAWTPEYQRNAWEQGFNVSNQPSGQMLAQSEQNQELSEYLQRFGSQRRALRYARYQSDVRAAEALAGDTPGPSWQGWSENVSMEDVKMQVVQNEGMDHHDFGLYGQPDLTLGRTPSLAGIASRLGNFEAGWDAHRASSVIGDHGWTPMGYSSGNPSLIPQVNINLNYDNRKTIKEKLRKEGLING